MPANTTPDQRCGACVKFEVSRDPKYGYCKSHMAYERERSPIPAARLVDVDHVCFMVSYVGVVSHAAFAPRKVSR